MRYLDLEDALHIADRVVEGEVLLRDVGLLDAALARPRATVFGKEAYPDLHEKAAALMHSVARNHALIDGNKRLALAGTIAFLGINGWRLTLTEDEAYDLVMAVAAGELDEVAPIAERLRAGSEPRPLPSR
ncbi:MAG: type II toxin-antitoxin system death-on-curing family toxin [Motilibacteraceae bacterium]